ncbi:MAG: methyltransferase domain-containing protein [Acidobacteria bacterium]|nr:methyltransferase domain-containing protein [Acidobacteriota bacterium]
MEPNHYHHDAQMRDESMERSLRYQAACIWPREKLLFSRLREEGLTRVLDMGCGTGEIASRLASEIHFPQVVGIDIIEERIRQAQDQYAHIGNLDFVHGDGTHIPFKDASFDLCVNRHVLQVVPDPEAMILEMARVTKPDGLLYILGEDYGMLHLTDLANDWFWQMAAQKAMQKNTHLTIGRQVPEILYRLGFQRVQSHTIALDTLNTDRELLAQMFKAWKDGYAQFLADMMAIPSEQAEAHFDRLIAASQDPSRYLVWHVPVFLAENQRN